MTALEMHKITEALAKVGYVVKKMDEVEYGSYDRPATGERYTGEITIKVRPEADEEAEKEKIRLFKQKELEALKPVVSEKKTDDITEGVAF